MALYTYVALNKKGKEEKGIIDANNIQGARNRLKAKGLYVRSVKEDKEKQERELFPFLTKLIYRISRKEVGLFTQQLGTLLGAGIPLDKSISNIIDQTENEYFKKTLIEMKTSITEGSTLSDAMAKRPDIFPQQYPSLVSVGEKTGQYESTLIRLAELEDAAADMRSKVQVAMIYPFIMGGLSLVVTIFLLTVVIPQIQELFSQFDAKLPLITRIVIGLSGAIINYWWLMIASIVGTVLGFSKYKSTEAGKKKWDNFILKIPIFGTLSRKVAISSFSRNMGVLLVNRVPLLTSLQIVTGIVENSLFRQEIREAIEKIKEGGRLADSLSQSTILTPMALGMLAAGEASDTVPEMMNKLAEIFDKEVDNAIKSMTQSLEPIMIVVMGGLIFTIMAAIMMPMYKLTQQIQSL